jgi:hypothetical protein
MASLDSGFVDPTPARALRLPTGPSRRGYFLLPSRPARPQACRNVAGRTVRCTGRMAAGRASPAAPGCNSRLSRGSHPATDARPWRGTGGTSSTPVPRPPIRRKSVDSARFSAPRAPFRVRFSHHRPPGRMDTPKRGFLRRHHVFAAREPWVSTVCAAAAGIPCPVGGL